MKTININHFECYAYLVKNVFVFPHVPDAFLSNSDVVMLGQIYLFTDCPKKTGRISRRMLTEIAFGVQPLVYRFRYSFAWFSWRYIHRVIVQIFKNDKRCVTAAALEAVT